MAEGQNSTRFLIPGKRKKDDPRFESAAEVIQVGTSSSSSLTIEDPIASDQHCEIKFRSGKFVISDLESATGSYLDGVPVQSETEIKDGAVLVLGATRITFKLAGDPEGSLLEMALSEKSFYFVEKGKGAKLADLYQWVRSEVVFGRSKILTWSNLLIGIMATALMGLSFVGGVREPLADPGALHASHAILFATLDGADESARDQLFHDEVALAREQGCSVCHDPFEGAPANKCAQCHAALLTDQHPGLVAKSGADEFWAASGCVQCHLDHTRAEAWDFVPSIEATEGSCGTCHSEDLQDSVAPAPIPMDRMTLVDYDGFGHDDHLSGENPIACSACHQRAESGDGDASDAVLGRDFAPVTFETCALCHLQEGAALATASSRDFPEAFLPTEPEHLVRLDWHGTDQGSENCTQCHDELYEKDLARVTIARAEGQRFAISERFEHGKFFEGHAEFEPRDGVEDCLECHRDGDVTPKDYAPQPFWHGLHMAQLAPGAGLDAITLGGKEAGCLSCHVEIETAQDLSGDAFGGTRDQCSQCHAAEPVASPSPASTREAVRFPHDKHVAAFGTSDTLNKGCFACHEFSDTDRYNAMALTLEGAESCQECHQGHDNIAGEIQGCILCHEADDRVYRKEVLQKPWPTANTFDHFSSGHVEGSSQDPGAGQDVDCFSCHDQENLRSAANIGDVAIPDESQDNCRDCHVAGRQRFHWR